MKTAYSAIKIFHHKEALDCIERNEICSPFYIRIKPTNFCNHHCKYCTYGSGDTKQKTENRDMISYKDMIPKDKMMEIIDDMGVMGVKAVTFSGGGEPLTYPYIVETVKEVKKRNIDLSLITNGQLLYGETAELFYDAKWVRISFDSPCAEEYAELRGISVAHFDSVVKNIEEFAKKKNERCVLGINYVISKYNYKRVYEAAALLKNIGVNNIKFAAVVDNNKDYHTEIKQEVISEIYRAKRELESETFQIINNYEEDCTDKNFSAQPFPICYTCRLVTVIGADQKIYLCHTRAYESKAVVADLKNKSFKDAWYSQETKEKLMELRPQKDCKNFCVYQERNELIQMYLDVNYDHINFI